MGYMVHHAIVVTSSITELIEEAQREAFRIFGTLVTPIVESNVNGYRSFLVAPDGSKEGWDESDLGDRRRSRFVAWLRSKYYSDGSSSLKWVEVQYGDAKNNTRAKRSSDRDALKFRKSKGSVDDS